MRAGLSLLLIFCTGCLFHDIESVKLRSTTAMNSATPDASQFPDAAGDVSARPDAAISADVSSTPDAACSGRTDGELCAQLALDCQAEVMECGTARTLDCGTCEADAFCSEGLCACTDSLVCGKDEACDAAAASCECNGEVRVGAPVCAPPYSKCGRDSCECEHGKTESCFAGFICVHEGHECQCDTAEDCGFGGCAASGQCDCAGDGVLCEFGARCASAGSGDCTCDGASCRPEGS